MDETFRQILWQQFGAAIKMLENAIQDCPEEVWGDRIDFFEFWYIAYHTLFWLDFGLSESPNGFAPPAPFGLEEFDPAGVLPDRVYTKAELQSYLEHGRQKTRAAILGLTDEKARTRFSILQPQLQHPRVDAGSHAACATPHRAIEFAAAATHEFRAALGVISSHD